MWSGKRDTAGFVQILSLLLLYFLFDCTASNQYHWVVKEATYTRLCSSKKILTVNGKFPGPVLRAHKGDTVYVNVHNEGSHNITIHWHGVRQPRNPWSDGPEYITQCPIQSGDSFTQKIIFSDEEGTFWWHAHSDWSRATVHGAIIVYPKRGASWLGSWLGGFAVNLGKGQVYEAELWSLYFGLQLASAKGITALHIEMDSMYVVRLLTQTKVDNFHPLETVIHSCRVMMGQLRECMLVHVFREKNQAADVLANWSYNMEVGMLSFDEPPGWLRSTILDDLAGVLRTRLVPEM